jgi:colicin import membrane protein
MLMLAMALAITGCNRASTPETAANDIAEAKQSAAQEVADAQQEAERKIDTADKAVQAKTADLADTNAKAKYDLAIAKADGERKIAEQQCMTKDGDAQKQCRRRVDADYDSARANAKAALPAHTQ